MFLSQCLGPTTIHFNPLSDILCNTVDRGKTVFSPFLLCYVICNVDLHVHVQPEALRATGTLSYSACILPPHIPGMWDGFETPSLVNRKGKMSALTPCYALAKCSFSHRPTATIFKLLILAQLYSSIMALNLSGDVHPNPGPKYPCGVCENACKWKQDCIVCDECETWLHRSCIGMCSDVFEALGNSSGVWLCDNCGIPHFDSNLFSESISFEHENQFSVLSETSHDSSFTPDIGDPLLTSSPVRPRPTGNSSKGNNRSYNGRGPNRRTSKPSRGNPIRIGKVSGESNLRILSLNLQGLMNKTQAFIEKVTESKPHIILATETWLTPEINSSECFPSNYTVFRKDRIGKGISRGGVLIAVRNDVIATHVIEFDVDTEVLWIKLQMVNTKPVYIGVFYRQPKLGSEPLKKLRESLSMIDRSKNPNIWLGGDFNVPDIDWSIPTRKQPKDCIYSEELTSTLLDILGEFSLHQLATEMNHIHQTSVHQVLNVLQLLCVTNPRAFPPIVTSPGISDHLILQADPDLKAKIQKASRRRVYKFSKANVEGLRSDMSSFAELFLQDADSLSVEENWRKFEKAILTATDSNIPSSFKSSRFNLPWMSRPLKRLIRRKQRAFYKAKETNKHRSWDRYRSLRKHVQKELKKAEHDYLNTTVFDSLCTDSKRFWSFIKGRRKDSAGISALWNGRKLVSSAVEKAEALSHQYKSIFTREGSGVLPSIAGSKLPSIPALTVHPDGILKLLSNLSSHKAPGPDGIHPFVLQKCATEITPILTKLFNQSINTGVLPSAWTKANITALFKKGSRTDPSNYRPVSLTSICCKIIEHVIYSHVMRHLDQHKALSNVQHGFRARRSCETQLLTTIHKIWNENEHATQVDAVILDFAKAFDTVPHRRLLHKLDHFGVNGSLHQWISSFLVGRQQSVNIQGTRSSPVDVLSGVPQGTVLGPLLFLMYINDLPDNLKSHVCLFADDCIVFRVISSVSDCEIIQSDLKQLENWEKKWMMSFKPEKCTILHFTRKSNKIQYSYKLSGHFLQTVDHHKYLGVTLSGDMKWNTHIDKSVSKAYSMLGFLRRNLSNAPRKVKIQAYKSIVRPHLEYCSSTWDPHTKRNINKIEMVQRRAARFICNDFGRVSSVTSMLKEIQLPSLQQRRKDQRLSMMHKIVHNNVDLRLEDHIDYNKRPTDSVTTRRHNPLTLNIPLSITKCHQMSFFPNTARDWNDLPYELTSNENSSTFRKLLAARNQFD